MVRRAPLSAGRRTGQMLRLCPPLRPGEDRPPALPGGGLLPRRERPRCGEGVRMLGPDGSEGLRRVSPSASALARSPLRSSPASGARVRRSPLPPRRQTPQERRHFRCSQLPDFRLRRRGLYPADAFAFALQGAVSRRRDGGSLRPGVRPLSAPPPRRPPGEHRQHPRSLPLLRRRAAAPLPGHPSRTVRRLSQRGGIQVQSP